MLSDSSAPGEGEHKIFEFVRLMRNEPGYNPNWRHVIHGLDADLIMLALATHEAHFYILREQVIFGKRPPQKKAMTVADLQASHKKSQQSSKKQGKHHEFDGNNHALLDDRKPLQFVKISIMREYLTWEFRPESFPTALPFEHDIERIIDDFILLCCFVGNDFLPHLPSMSIREGALDLMLILYRQHLPAIGGYLTDSGSINLRNASIILGKFENYIIYRKEIEKSEDCVVKVFVVLCIFLDCLIIFLSFSMRNFFISKTYNQILLLTILLNLYFHSLFFYYSFDQVLLVKRKIEFLK